MLAAVAAIGLSISLSLWATLMADMDVNRLWSVWPIAILLFVATWLLHDDWVLERPSWRGTAGPPRFCLCPRRRLLSPWRFSVFTRFRSFRPAWDRTSFHADDAGGETDGRSLSPRTARLLVSYATSNDEKLLADNPKPLALILEASGRPTSKHFRADGPELFNALPYFPELVLASAKQLQTSGKLDEATRSLFRGLHGQPATVDDEWALERIYLSAGAQGLVGREGPNREADEPRHRVAEKNRFLGAGARRAIAIRLLERVRQLVSQSRLRFRAIGLAAGSRSRLVEIDALGTAAHCAC